MDTYSDDSNEQLTQITEISKLLSVLYNQLESVLSDPNASYNEGDDIIENIETLTRVKKILINNYLQMNANAQQTSISQRIAYDETMSAINASDKLISESKKNISVINQDKYNRLRLIEINNYYGSQYSNHQKIILYLIVLCVFFLITIILKNRNILSNNIFYIINIIVVSISFICIGYMVKDSYDRSNMMYDEYDYGFNYNQTISNYPVTTTNSKDTSSNIPSISCNIDGSKFCSENQTFNVDSKKCEINPAPATEINSPTSLSGDLFIIDKSNNTEIQI